MMHVTKTDDMRVPLKSWAVNAEAGAIEQAVNLSRLPFAMHHVALMPDAHQGYGMPIGGVLFADKAVVPYAVGVDIGCGVMLIETSLTTDDLSPERTTAILHGVRDRVPVGNGPQAQHAKPGADWFGLEEVAHSDVAAEAIEKARVQLGTLGGGNHFLELQRDETGGVWFMLHSGSRSVGKKICDHWHAIALAANTRWFSQLPHKELAYLPWVDDAAQEYWQDMNAALGWAEENRARMGAAVVEAIDAVGFAAAPILDIHHNYATWENHFGHNGIVHRKGAVRARAGETVLIPGSMGTASYVAEGLGNRESFETCQHGAGRARSRGDTRRSTTLDAMDAQLANAGVTLVTPNRADVIDESAIAYKDIEAVMAASADLVTPIRRHLPVGVVKG